VPRLSYSYGRCENPFFTPVKPIHALRFSQSSQLLLVASQQVWSESAGTAAGECAPSHSPSSHSFSPQVSAAAAPASLTRWRPSAAVSAASAPVSSFSHHRPSHRPPSPPSTLGAVRPCRRPPPEPQSQSWPRSPADRYVLMHFFSRFHRLLLLAV